MVNNRALVLITYCCSLFIWFLFISSAMAARQLPTVSQTAFRLGACPIDPNPSRPPTAHGCRAKSETNP
ncbi:hypothetical protein CsSME_00037145 [Camellia sinensis var. sinensis]